MPNDKDLLAKKVDLASKQDTLIAGTNITIAADGKTISAANPTSVTVTPVYQAGTLVAAIIVNGNTTNIYAPAQHGDNANQNLAVPFSAAQTYEVGDFVIYQENLYKCITAISTPAAWDSTKWMRALITNEMGQGSGGDYANQNIADTYNITSTYAVGDYVIYAGLLYKCIAAVETPGPFNATYWEHCVVTDEMGSGGGGGTSITKLWDAGFTPSPGVWLEYDFGEDLETYDAIVILFVVSGWEGNNSDSVTVYPKIQHLNTTKYYHYIKGTDYGIQFWRVSGTTYGLGSIDGNYPPQYKAVYGIKYGSGGGGGSSVIPNPQDPVTDTLTKVEINGTVYDIAGGGGSDSFDGLDWDNAETLTLPDTTGYTYTPSCEGVIMLTTYGEVGGMTVKRTGYDDIFLTCLNDTWTTEWVPVTTTEYTLKKLSTIYEYPQDSWAKFIPWKTSGGGSGSGYSETNLYTANSTSFVDIPLTWSLTDYDAYLFFCNDVNTQTGNPWFITQEILTDLIGTQNTLTFYPFDNAGVHYYVTTTQLTAHWNSQGFYIRQIVGLNFGSGGGSNTHNYSTSEQVVGTWIDGSDLFEKTLTFTSPNITGDDSTSDLVHGVSNIDVAWVETALYKSVNQGIPRYQNIICATKFASSDSDGGISTWEVGDRSIYSLTTTYSSLAGREFVFVIRYTKSAS